MILIAHRGNLQGPNPSKENDPAYIDLALKQNINAEVDLRVKNKIPYLGHDYADFAISSEYLIDRQDFLWIHCKDAGALTWALERNLHCFWHDQDDYTITSKGFVWAYPGKEVASAKCISVMPETVWHLDEVRKNVDYGICTDYVNFFRNEK